MTEKEHRVRQMELDVRKAQSRVAAARRAMDEGYKKLQAELEAGYAKLKDEYQREVLDLQKDKAALEYARADLAKGYE